MQITSWLTDKKLLLLRAALITNAFPISGLSLCFCFVAATGISALYSIIFQSNNQLLISTIQMYSLLSAMGNYCCDMLSLLAKSISGTVTQGNYRDTQNILNCGVFVLSGERAEAEGSHSDWHSGHIAGLVHALQDDRS